LITKDSNPPSYMFFTFNSEEKHEGLALKKSETEVHIHWKGAAEIILGLCKTWIDSSGSVQEMTPNKVWCIG